jgi:hypothetical protein
VWTEMQAKKKDMIEVDQETVDRIRAGDKPEVHIYQPPTPEKIVRVVFDKDDKEQIEREALESYKRNLKLEKVDGEKVVDEVEKEIKERGLKVEEVDVTKKAEDVKIELAPEEDPELKKIMGLKNKNQAEEYALLQFKVSIDRRKTLDNLKEELVAFYKAQQDKEKQEGK